MGQTTFVASGGSSGGDLPLSRSTSVPPPPAAGLGLPHRASSKLTGLPELKEVTRGALGLQTQVILKSVTERGWMDGWSASVSYF